MLSKLAKRCRSPTGKEELTRAMVGYYTEYQLKGFDVKEHLMDDDVYRQLAGVSEALDLLKGHFVKK